MAAGKRAGITAKKREMRRKLLSKRHDRRILLCGVPPKGWQRPVKKTL